MRIVRYALSALASSVAVSVVLLACDQPKPRCTITTRQFIARYKNVSGRAECDAVKTEAFRSTAYFGLKDTPKFVGEPDTDSISIAIKPVAIGALFTRADGEVEPGEPRLYGDESKAYLFTKFASITPDEQDFCSVPTFDQPVDIAFQPLAAIPPNPKVEGDKGTPAAEATRYQYEFSDFKIYVVASAPGTAFQTKVKRTVTVGAGQPVACDYEATAIAPRVPCDTDLDCAPTPDPDAGHPVGSGLNPDFTISCDTALGFCLPPADAPFPPLKK